MSNRHMKTLTFIINKENLNSSRISIFVCQEGKDTHTHAHAHSHTHTHTHTHTPSTGTWAFINSGGPL